MHHLPRSFSFLYCFLITPAYVYGHGHQEELKTNYSLLIDAPDLILVDQGGNKHRIRSTNGVLQPDTSIIKSIIKKNDETLIELSDSTRLVFYGSYLVEYSNAGGITEQINYKGDETPYELRCESTEPIRDDQCKSIGEFTFSSPLLTNNTIQIDIRPANCKSYFDDFLHTRRGLQIESALATYFKQNGYTPTPQTFPVIDFVRDSTAHIIKSRDLSNENFQLKDALYDQLILDVQEINQMFEENNELSANFQNQSMTINQNQIKKSVLNIIIQNGLATESQKQQILRVLNELEGRSDISLNIIEIP